MVMSEFVESDWKVYRSKIVDWQENYMARLCKEYVSLLESDEIDSEKFWKLSDRIKHDVRSSGVVIRNSRLNMKENIYRLLTEGVITLNDLDGFSAELQSWATHITEE